MYKRKGRDVYWTWVYVSEGDRRQVSLGTALKLQATDIDRMLQLLAGRREWRLLRAVFVEKVVTLGALYDAYRDDALDALKQQLDDADLTQYMAGWEKWAARTAGERTVRDYVRQLKLLWPDGKLLRSMFTRQRISQTLLALPHSGSTQRRYLAAWSSFAQYLVEMEVLPFNPVRDIKAPSEGAPREVWLELSEVQKLVEAQPEPYRALAALREGCGAEIGAALAVRVRDVGAGASVVHLHGTKNAWRDRYAYLESWARPYILAACKGKLPDALLFPVRYQDALDVHRAALRATGLRGDYTMHDARHSLAVRWMQLGLDPNLISSNLGHKDATLVLRVYGKYRPKIVNFEKLEAAK